MAGTPRDLETAKMFLSLLQEHLGIPIPEVEPIYSAGTPQSRDATLSMTERDQPTAWIDTYFPVLNTPLDRRLEILDEEGRVVWKADLEEYSDESDPDAHRHARSVPAFHGLSRDGDVKGEIVYANYGRPEDFQSLLEDGAFYVDCYLRQWLMVFILQVLHSMAKSPSSVLVGFSVASRWDGHDF